MVPKARSANLLVTELDGEFVVYDQTTDRAHSLNRTATLVWRHADGRTSNAALAALLERELGVSAGEELVGLALDRLRQAKLLEEAPAAGVKRMPRREAVRRLAGMGIAAALLPIVTSITAPTAAATSSLQQGTPGPTSQATSTPTATATPAPCNCPTCAQALGNATVTNACDSAWTDSNAGNAANRHEEGGWVIMSTVAPACTLRVSRVAAGERAGLAPGANPAGANERACGFFHTHPNPAVDEKGRKWDQGPSGADTAWHNARGLWGIVRNAAGNQCF